MSYILEALKKSDQQRQRSVTPTLPTASPPLAEPRQPALIYTILLAIVLLTAGILIGWLRPWQAEPPTPATATAVVTAPAPVTVATPAPQPYPPIADRKPVTAPTVVQPTQVKSEWPTPAESPNTAPAPVSNPEKPTHAAATSSMTFSELPLPIQQEIPTMTIPLHAYSSKPKDRFVSINGKMLREGGAISPELKLEEITKDGVILNYKGYRYRRGVQ